MTWSIHARGTKEECLAAVEASKAHEPWEGEPNARQHDRAKAIIVGELKRFADDSHSITVEAYGHVPDAAGGTRSTTIKVSGEVPAMKPVEATLDVTEIADTKE